MKLQSIYKTFATTALLGQLLTTPLPSLADSTGKSVQKTTQNEKQSAALGLLGYYFTNQDFTDLSIMQKENGSELKLGKTILKNFKPEKQKIQSVRYVGSIQPSESGDYQFSTSKDEHVAIQIDGKTIMNQKEMEGTISLEKDKIYSIRIEYLPETSDESKQDIDLQLFWKALNGKKEMIPKENLLFPDEKDDHSKEENRLIPTTPVLEIGPFYSSGGTATTELDTDGDGLPDSWETSGYTVVQEPGKDKNGKGIIHGQKVKWENLLEETKKILPQYKSNPNNAHTAGDPYTDLEKALGHMDDGIKIEAYDPRVAAYPAVGVNMEKLIFSENKDITKDTGGSISKSTSSSSTSSHTEEWGESATVEVSASLTDFGVKASATLSHSDSTTKSTTASVENSSGENWSTQVHLNSSQAAFLNPNIRYFNAGTAPMHDVRPTVGLSLGPDTLATITAQENNIGSVLLPGDTYPAKGQKPMSFKTSDQFSAHPIEVNSSQLKCMQKGLPLTLEVNQVGGTYKTRSKDGKLISSADNKWESMIKTRIQPATALLSLDTGKEIVERRVAAKGIINTGRQDNAHNPELTLKEAIKIAFHATEDSDGNLSYKDQEGKAIPLNEKAVQMITDEKTRTDIDTQLKNMSGNEKHLYNVKLKQGMKIILKAPYYYDSFSETSKKRWTEYSSDSRKFSTINNNTLLLKGPKNGISLENLKPNMEYAVEFEAKAKGKTTGKNAASTSVTLKFFEHGNGMGRNTSKAEKNPDLNETSFKRLKYRFWTTNATFSKQSYPMLILYANQVEVQNLKIIEVGPFNPKK